MSRYFELNIHVAEQYKQAYSSSQNCNVTSNYSLNQTSNLLKALR